MTGYQAGGWMPWTPPHGKPVIGKPEPPPKRKQRPRPRRKRHRKRR